MPIAEADLAAGLAQLDEAMVAVATDEGSRSTWAFVVGPVGIEPTSRPSTSSPATARAACPGLHATYVLYDAHTGVPLAMMDGNEITAHRTAAASALGASFLARADARRLLVLGTGRVARLLPAAHATVRAIDEVGCGTTGPKAPRRWPRNGAAKAGTRRPRPISRPRCASADIVSCATLATSPLVRGEWLAPGSHLDLIGSFTPQMREADPACFAGARTFVDTEEALPKAGDLLDAIAAGTLRARWRAGHARRAVPRHARRGARGDGERTVFKAVGSALEDLAAATLVWQAADREPQSSETFALLDHVAEALGLALHELVELLARGREGLVAEALELLLHVGFGQRLLDVALDLVGDGGRQALAAPRWRSSR